MTVSLRVGSAAAGVRLWLQQHATGVALCATTAAASAHLASQFGGSTFLYALLLGAALHPLSQGEFAAPGIDLCARTLLRWGVALLGARITWAQISGLGLVHVGIVAAAVVTTIVFGVLLASRLGMARWKGLLSGGATAICGASAALALAAALPKGPEKDRFTLVVVVAVSALSTLAMVAYPLVATLLRLTAPQAGLLLGGTIHDVAQVVAAGFMLSDTVGEYATVVKLLRVSLLALVVAVTALAYRRASKAGKAGISVLPWFLILFVALAAANSLSWMSQPAVSAADIGSRFCLLIAVSALGAKSSMRKLASAGWRTGVLLAAETLWLAMFVLVCIHFIA
ncbi:putative sulfate exporter family transporter [Variovorax sp. CF079]|uniref:YeiH family protein n=1 Tax=Variovorax sp. CF079 TaxID=1882774 RepID=UPI00147F5ECE|nr:putative sulfate exporter family transporter [Variovorax sp. CF079]